MAIVQISRIQHRRGKSESGPGALDPAARLQLASAELGWSIDTQQLYIGNGTVEEGAPQIGNTEILTEHSDLLSVTRAYTYKGDLDIGYVAQTGPSFNFPAERSLQQKLDDFVSVRDFGAVGDGVRDDTDGINQALREIYCRESEATVENLARKTLYFPAGKYRVTDLIEIPTYATIRGDGIDHSVIFQDNAESSGVAHLVDSLGQSRSNLGLGLGVLPKYVTIEGVTFTTDKELPTIFRVEKASSVFFRNVRFSGNTSSTSVVDPGTACVGLYSDSSVNTNDIHFDACEFDGQTYGAYFGEIGVSNVVFNASNFHDTHVGIRVSDTLTAALKGIKIFGSSFNDIFSSAINSGDTENLVSAFNYFADVGNRGGGAEKDNVVVFSGQDCYSFGDTFDRTDSDNLTWPRVSSASEATITVIPHDSIQYGERKIGGGVSRILAAGTTANTTATLDISSLGATVSYIVQRDSNVRYGTLAIAQVNGTVMYTDEYTETGNVGVTLSATVSGNVTTVWANVTSGTNPTFKYSIDSFKS